MKTIELRIECPACKATGVYKGMAERDGAAVVCHQCKGTGAYNYKFSYEDFTGIKPAQGVKRVYLSGYGYVIAPSEIEFGDHGLIDMRKEGVSYEAFQKGERPSHIKSLACPMLADQGDCQDIKGFVDECMEIHGGWIGRISECKGQCQKSECWKRFDSAPSPRSQP